MIKKIPILIYIFSFCVKKWLPGVEISFDFSKFKHHEFQFDFKNVADAWKHIYSLFFQIKVP